MRKSIKNRRGGMTIKNNAFMGVFINSRN